MLALSAIVLALVFWRKRGALPAQETNQPAIFSRMRNARSTTDDLTKLGRIASRFDRDLERETPVFPRGYLALRSDRDRHVLRRTP